MRKTLCVGWPNRCGGNATCQQQMLYPWSTLTLIFHYKCRLESGRQSDCIWLKKGFEILWPFWITIGMLCQFGICQQRFILFITIIFENTKWSPKCSFLWSSVFHGYLLPQPVWTGCDEIIFVFNVKLRLCTLSVCSTNNPQPCLYPSP